MKFFANFGVFPDIETMENVDLEIRTNKLNISIIRKIHTLLRCGKSVVRSVDFYFLKVRDGNSFMKSLDGCRLVMRSGSMFKLSHTAVNQSFV